MEKSTFWYWKIGIMMAISSPFVVLGIVYAYIVGGFSLGTSLWDDFID